MDVVWPQFSLLQGLRTTRRALVYWQLIAGYSLGRPSGSTTASFTRVSSGLSPPNSDNVQPLAERRTIEPLFAQGTLREHGIGQLLVEQAKSR